MSNILHSLWSIDKNTTPQSGCNDSQFYREALQNGQDYLQEQFQKGDDIVDLVHQRTLFVDDVLQHLWHCHIDADSPMSLLAVGGYGRGELHPYSDIDLLVLLDESVSEKPPQGLSDFLTQLWDIGLEIGHSVRTIKECRKQAELDITIATNLLETRLLCGQEALFSALNLLTVTNKAWDTKRFYQAKKQEQVQRHKKYNDTANSLEPNIKEAPGGLRDLQIINWVAQQHFDVDDFHGLNQKGFLESSEYELLNKCQTFLWKIRFAMHFQAKRKQENMMIDYQRTLAEQFGYKDTEHRLAVEQFMKDYYRCARSIEQMNELLLQIFEENIILADEPCNIEPINRRFQIHNGYLETLNANIFTFYPYAMLELFLLLEQEPNIKGVRADTIRQLHANRHLIDDRFRADIKSQTLFMEIIRQPKGITHEFRRMNKLDILGCYLPNFGQIVGQMQHDLFHAYTVDEHTLFLVRNLRRFSCPEFRDELPLCSQAFQDLAKPELLYIAGLFHDIAKGRGGNHSELGVADASEFCHQHSLSDCDTNIVCFLVRQHLTMSSTAQKLDIDDPDVIKKFSSTVQTVEQLNYLYLLTVADIRATNNNLWNGWRDSLLKRLYQATRNYLDHNKKTALNVEEESLQRQHAAKEKLAENWPIQTIDALWHNYDNDYFLRHTADQIIWQSQQRLENPNNTLLVSLRRHDQEDTLEIFILSPDRLGIFAATTYSLEQHQLDILDAKINATHNGLSLSSYIVKGDSADQGKIIRSLEKQLNDLDDIKTYKPSFTPRKMTLFETEATIHFKNNTQRTHTVLELKIHDRPGLISSISQLFLSCEVQLINAKLVTLGDQVENIFLISNSQHTSLNNEEQETLKQALISGLTPQIKENS